MNRARNNFTATLKLYIVHYLALQSLASLNYVPPFSDNPQSSRILLLDY